MRFAFPVGVYFLWRLVIFSYQMLLEPTNQVTSSLYHKLFFNWVKNWDGGHYTGIAANGYQFPQQAFFPLWPLLIKALSLTGMSVYMAAYLLSFILGLTTFILFYVLASKLLNKQQAKYALILFACFPSTMFLHASYTEPLFLTLVLLSFWLLEKKHYFFSALTGGIATSSRFVGVAVAVSYPLLKKPLIKRIFWTSLALSGLVAYMFYLQVVYHNPLYFKDAEETWCPQQQCNWSFPFDTLSTYGNLISLGWIKPSLYFGFIDWTAATIFILLTPVVLKKLGLNYFLYSLLVILPRLSSGTTVAMIRFVLVAFPIFFILPSLLRFRIIIVIVSLLLLLLQLRFVDLFINGLWVA